MNDLPRGVRLAIRVALRSWPSTHRGTLGKDLEWVILERLSEIVRHGPPKVWRETLAECGNLVYEGCRLRLGSATRFLRQLVSGCGTDIHHSLRALRRSPSFAALAVLTLSLGIGANTSVFSLVDQVVLRGPPYERPEELVFVWGRLPTTPAPLPVTAPDAAFLEERTHSLEGLAFTTRVSDGAIEARAGDAADHVRLATVTPDFFAVLGAQAAIGRIFASGEVATGDLTADGAPGPSEVVLADEAWRRVFAADPAVVGRDVLINGRPATVIGIMPPGFRLVVPPGLGIDDRVDVWLPLPVPLSAFQRAGGRRTDQDSDNTGAVIARLGPGSSIEQARREVTALVRELRAQVPEYGASQYDMQVRPLQEHATAQARSVLVPLLAGAGLVLLVACMNLAALLLARGEHRGADLAIRAALGAGRMRIARQLVVEAATLAGVGTLTAVGVAYALLRAWSAVLPHSLAPATPLELDGRTLVVASGLGVLCALTFGLFPLVRAGRLDARGALGSTFLRSHAVKGHARSFVVVGQVAISVALLVAAGLLLRSAQAMRQVDPGFEAEGALAFSVSLRIPGAYSGPADRARLMSEIEGGVRQLTGVAAVGLVGTLPLSGAKWTQPYGLPGQAESEWAQNRADFRVVTSEYFDAVGSRLVAGRGFTAQEDLVEDGRVVIVDEQLARRVAADGNALGSTLAFPLDGSVVEARIVGVVESVRSESLAASPREAIYVPYRQEASREVTFVVRTLGDPDAMAPTVHSTVAEIDPRIPVYDVHPLTTYVAGAMAPLRFGLLLLSVFSLLALVSVAVGLYGVVAFDVSRRTREFGVRMALGADRRQVAVEVLETGARRAAIGLAAGVGLGVVAARGLSALVYGVGLGDLATWLGVITTVGIVTLLASLIPAMRASRIDPMSALRTE
jgi:putative ABC transport system permease protein